MVPIFVGGTGRSGTTVVGQLLGHHRHLAATLPKEIRFLTDRGGLLDLIDAPTQEAVDAFVDDLRGKWWSRIGPDGGQRGLVRGVSESILADAVRRFRRAVQDDPIGASAALTHALVDPMATRAGAGAWVETTPANAARAWELARLFPDLKVIHMVRDGRDTIASVLDQAWGPTTVSEAVAWWERESRRAAAGVGRLHTRSGAALTIHLEALVGVDRDEVYQGLLDFLAIDDDPAMHSFFASMTPASAAVGRWRRMAEPDRSQLEAAFRSHLI